MEPPRLLNLRRVRAGTGRVEPGDPPVLDTDVRLVAAIPCDDGAVANHEIKHSLTSSGGVDSAGRWLSVRPAPGLHLPSSLPQRGSNRRANSTSAGMRQPRSGVRQRQVRRLPGRNGFPARSRRGGACMPFAELDKVRISYEESGAGEPVVWSHEYAGDHRSWQPQLDYFDRFYRNIVYDHRGYPPSSVPEDPAAYSQDLLVAD